MVVSIEALESVRGIRASAPVFLLRDRPGRWCFPCRPSARQEPFNLIKTRSTEHRAPPSSNVTAEND